jgi:formate C-acetyltransferase
LPSLHTLDTNVGYGKNLYTTLDGRLKGEPVNKNAGPTDDVRTGVPTGIALSAAALPQYKFSGGQPIDVYFDKKSFSGEENRKKIASLIKVYFKSGGMQLQVNSVDPALLEKACENPEAYRSLVVRIGGFSMRFCDMSRGAQEELILRLKKESGAA